MSAEREGGYILEVYTVGGYTKVAAVDPATGLEVSVFGPASPLSLEPLKRQAVRKLENALKKQDGRR